MFPKWVFLGAEETVPVGFCSFILSSGYRYTPSPWLIFNFHFPLIRIGARVVQWLTCPQSSLSVFSLWCEGCNGKEESKGERGLPPFFLPTTPCSCCTHYVKTSQVQWWHTCLPLMWPRFKFRCRCHMWVEFVVGSLLCSERFFSGYFDFPLSLKTNTSKFHFDLECRDIFKRVLKDS